MGDGLKRARDAARATRGLPPVTVHLRSTTGSTCCGGYGSCGCSAPLLPRRRVVIDRERYDDEPPF